MKPLKRQDVEDAVDNPQNTPPGRADVGRGGGRGDSHSRAEAYIIFISFMNVFIFLTYFE